MLKIFYAFTKKIIIKLKLYNAIHSKSLRKHSYVFLGLFLDSYDLITFIFYYKNLLSTS